MVTSFPTHGIEFSIPMLPPSVNAIYKIGRAGNFYTDKKVSDDFLMLAKSYVPKRKVPMTGNIVLHVSFCIKDKRKYSSSDTSNYIKVLEDTLVKVGALENDNDIVKIFAQKLHGHQDMTSGCIDHAGAAYLR